MPALSNEIELRILINKLKITLGVSLWLSGCRRRLAGLRNERKRGLNTGRHHRQKTERNMIRKQMLLENI